VIVAWFLVNGSGEGYGRLLSKRLLGIGFGGGDDPVVWFAALGLVTLLLGAGVLRAVEAGIDGAGAARRTYVVTCAAGVLGLVLFAAAPDVRWAVVGSLLVSGSAAPGAVLRTVGEIWVNRRTTSEVRATVHSLLSQAEQLGEILFGLVLAGLAAATTATASLGASAALLAAAGVVAAGAGRGSRRARALSSPGGRRPPSTGPGGPSCRACPGG
jgi:hypothetical protein